MKGVCPECGAEISLAQCVADADARKALALAFEVPGNVGRLVVPYFGLFRPPSGTIQWRKVLRLTRDLQELVLADAVTYDRKPAKANSPRVWEMALEKILECRPKNLPLANHNYLRAIAWEVADELSRVTEAARNKAPKAAAASTRAEGVPEAMATVCESIGAGMDVSELRAVRQLNAAPATGGWAALREFIAMFHRVGTSEREIAGMIPAKYRALYESSRDELWEEINGNGKAEDRNGGEGSATAQVRDQDGP